MRRWRTHAGSRDIVTPEQFQGWLGPAERQSLSGVDGKWFVDQKILNLITSEEALLLYKFWLYYIVLYQKNKNKII